MSSVFSKIVHLSNKYMVVRGMVSYAVIFPTSCLIQQTLSGKTWKTYDWMKVVRFGIYGSLYIAPISFGWMRITSTIYYRKNWQHTFMRVFMDQIAISPFMIGSFYGLMNLLEGKSIYIASEEIKSKFMPTYKAGLCFWPIMTTINFTFIPMRNRVPFLSLCGLVWTSYLANMHEKSNSTLRSTSQ